MSNNKIKLIQGNDKKFPKPSKKDRDHEEYAVTPTKPTYKPKVSPPSPPPSSNDKE